MARKAKKFVGELKIINTVEFWDKLQQEIEWGIDYMPEGNYRHVSFSYSDRLPTWEDVKRIKEKFFGNEFVFQVLPKKKYYINHHKYCLHLFQYLGEKSE